MRIAATFLFLCSVSVMGTAAAASVATTGEEEDVRDDKSIGPKSGIGFRIIPMLNQSARASFVRPKGRTAL